MESDLRIRRFAIAALLIIVSLTLTTAIGFRAVMLSTHFTDVDDIGVAASIFEARRNIADVSDLRAIINNPKLRQIDTFKFKALRWADSLGILAPAFRVLTLFRDVFAVPLRWSYAPGQYLLTPWLLHDEASYRSTLAAGRAPSALFSILAIALIGFSAWKLESQDNFVTTFALATSALSLEFIGFSVHMSNYAAGVFASSALCYIVIGRLFDGPPVRTGAKLGLLLFVLILLSYQVLILIPAALATIALSAAMRSGTLPQLARWPDFIRAVWQTKAVRAIFIAGIIFAILLLPTFMFLMSSIQRITWNSGLHDEFVFNWPPQSTIVDALIYLLHFTSWNFLQVFAAVLSPVPEYSPAYWPIAFVFLVLLIAGLVSQLRNPAGTRPFTFGIFVLLAVFTYIVMAWLKLLAMSPTRHALVFLPLFAITVGTGAAMLMESITRNRTIRTGLAATALVIALLTSAYYLPSELDNRRDPFDEATLSGIIDSTGVRIVAAYDHTYNLELMPSVRSKVALFNQQNLNFPWLDGKLPERPTPILFVSQRHPLTAADLKTLLDEMNQTLPKEKALTACLDPASILRQDMQLATNSFEISRATKSAASGYFITVVKLRPDQQHC